MELDELKTQLARMVQDLNDWANIAADQTDLDVMALIWDAGVEMKGIISTLEAVLGPRMHDAIVEVEPEQKWVETAAGIYKTHWRGTKYTWDDDGVIKELVDQATEKRQLNTRTGELESELDAFLRLLRKTGRINYWLVRELESLDIKPTEYRERHDGNKWVTSV